MVNSKVELLRLSKKVDPMNLRVLSILLIEVIPTLGIVSEAKKLHKLSMIPLRGSLLAGRSLRTKLSFLLPLKPMTRPLQLTMGQLALVLRSHSF